MAGSAVLGALVGAGVGAGAVVAPLLAAGFCGSLTTFSSAAVDVARASRRTAGSLGTAHLLGALTGAALGLGVGTWAG